MNKRKSTGVLVCLLVATGVYLLVQAGSLDPPGPPAPTKTAVNETDPRTPIRAADLPLTITEPGSYYLAENIIYAEVGDGITVDASNVSIDLMGFSLSGGWGNGIVARPGTEQIEIKNGKVEDWSKDGIDLSSAYYVKVTNVQALSNEDNGIAAGYHGIISDCIVGGNGFGNYNGAGIAVRDGFHVSGNVCHGNLWGILILGTGNRIDGNHLRQNDEGITALGAGGGNIIVRNSAGQSYVAPYSIHPSNDVGPIGAASSSTSPWANIIY